MHAPRTFPLIPLTLTALLSSFALATADEKNVAGAAKKPASDQPLEYQILKPSGKGIHSFNRASGWKALKAQKELQPTILAQKPKNLTGTAITSGKENQFIALRKPRTQTISAPPPPASSEPTPPSNPKTNFIIIVTDDQRWDVTGFMQQRMATLGRIARFPYLVDQSDPMNPVSRTPNLDRLSQEGIHFDNGFCVYSLCSPSRSVMLTGLYPHRTGVTGNDQDFPADAVTYATILRDAGWATGYFGKWHHGTQSQRPGFDTQQSFRGQGNYFNTTFYNETGTATVSSKWVDEQTTDYALDFINNQQAQNKPFVAFLGFKTPHGPRQDGNGQPNTPVEFRTLFTSTDPVAVPNLLSQGATAPPWKPDANSAGLGNDPRNYLRLISAADAQIGRILDRLTALNITENTAVIFLSDNGYFIGEHGLSDKRAGYEESLRIPFMIRYPRLQPSGAGNIAPELALNVDLAPTIIDLAGLPIPATMQGRSLKPLIAHQSPADWPTSFFFSYVDDPEFPGSTADFIGIRHNDGRKLMRYARNPAWNEFYKTSPFSPNPDPYEINNLIANPAQAATVSTLQASLDESAAQLGFLEQISLLQGNPVSLDVKLGETYPFRLETSTNLETWNTASTIEGAKEQHSLDLIAGPPATWDLTVPADTADYTLIGGNPFTSSNTAVNLFCGATNGVGRDAVLVFALPPLPEGQKLRLAQLEVSAKKSFAKWWDADLWALGIKDNSTPILEYHGQPSTPAAAGIKKLQDALFDATLPDTATTIRSSLASGLSGYLRTFYQNHPNYTGGKFLFLRINPEKFDMSGEGNERFDIASAENTDPASRPKLHLSFESQTMAPSRFWRVSYGHENP